MPVPRDHQVYAYAQRLCGRIPGRLEELLHRTGLTSHAFAMESGVSREMLGRILKGKSVPGTFVTAQISAASGLTLVQFFASIDDPPPLPPPNDSHLKPPGPG